MAKTLPEVVREQVPDIDSKGTDAKKYMPFLPDKFIKGQVVAEIKKTGATLTPEQEANITVKDGVIRSPDFVILKQSLGLNADNNAMNEQLETALKNEKVQVAIRDAMKDHSAQTQVARAPAQPTPNDPAPNTPAQPSPTVVVEQTPQVQAQGPVATVPSTAPTSAPSMTQERDPALTKAIEMLGELANIPVVKQFIAKSEQQLEGALGKQHYDHLKTMIIGTMGQIAASPEFGKITETVGKAMDVLRDFGANEMAGKGIAASLSMDRIVAANGQGDQTSKSSEPRLAGRFDASDPSVYQRAMDQSKEHGLDNGAVVLGELASPKVPNVKTASARSGPMM